MKLFLAIALILAVTIDFGDCMDRTAGIFHMDQDEFHKLVDSKIEPYLENALEIDFLGNFYAIIAQNYFMFERIYGYINTINSHEVILCQVTANDGGKKVVFPDSDVINKLKQVKESLEKKLFTLLDSILPAYDRNRHFLNMLENMSVNTLIDRKLIYKFAEESKKVVQFSKDFEELFRNFQMEDYKKQLNNIQCLATKLKFGQVSLETAKRELDEILTKFDGVRAEMKKKLNLATKLGFTKLQQATKKFHGYAIKELKSTMKYEPRTTAGIKDLYKFNLPRKSFKL